ncbi:MAG: HAD-IC family P-type ATPase [Cytophagales bacterium]|nr:HAD-IC family P-type ATPase [Cytophaga sp.]
MDELKHFYITDKQGIIGHFQTSETGLEDSEINTRKEKYGPNSIPEKKGQSFFKIMINQFVSLLVLILIGCGVVTLLLGEYVDAAFIFLIIFINAIMGAYQEWKAERNASALSKMVEVKAKVVRGNNTIVIDAKDLVPGDVIKLESGDKVPADVRLIDVNGLQIEEALLTGESVPVQKKVEVLQDDNIPIGDQVNMAFSGTAVTSGRATGIVVATGLETEIGKIAGQMHEMESNKAPLVHRMEVFSKRISIYTLFLCLLAGAIAFYRGNELYDVFFLVIALAVSAIPEGLPIAITVALSIGSRRMSKRNVIVRKLAAVEGLGSCTVIATDKTGTLTVDQQTVKKLLLPGNTEYTFEGVGYIGEGEIKRTNGQDNEEALTIALTAMILCNEASLIKKENWEHHGDSVDVALLAAAYKKGLNLDEVKKQYPVQQQIPFESERKYSGVVIQLNGEPKLLVKGAFEAFEKVLTDSEAVSKQVFDLSAEGYRVIVLAASDQSVANVNPDTLPPLHVIGLIALIDPIREEVKPAIMECQKAGIKIAMVTGDHPATALHIAKEIGIAKDKEEVISGVELSAFQNENGDISFKEIEKKTVFARVSPQQKYKIVEAFKANGHFVAVTGDGVNDAPALKTANIGAAMGYGTDVAKEAASIIITDNNFASITAAVEEGRYIYSNIRKVVYLLISTGFAEIFTIILALAFNTPIPFTAIQLLWLNLVTNGIQEVAVAFEKGDPEEMKKPPRDPNEPIFNKTMMQEVILSGTVMSVVVFIVWNQMLNGMHESEAHSRSAVLLLMVIFQNFHLLNCRSETKSIFQIPIKNNYFLWFALIGAQGIHVLVSYIPFIAKPLQLIPYTLSEWGAMMVCSVSILIVMELYKVILRIVKKK